MWLSTVDGLLVAPQLAGWLDLSRRPMEITSKATYPAGALSNFAPHRFRFRGFEIGSMEGLLQGLKCRSPGAQARVFALVGAKAKKVGAKHDWKSDQTLYWQGEPVDRHGDDYQSLLDEAYQAMFAQNHKARRALLATGDAVLTHSIGEGKPQDTVLTSVELCDRLMRVRDELRGR